MQTSAERTDSTDRSVYRVDASLASNLLVTLNRYAVAKAQIPPSGTLCFPPLELPTNSYPFDGSSTLSSCPSSAANPLSLREVVGIF